MFCHPTLEDLTIIALPQLIKHATSVTQFWRISCAQFPWLVAKVCHHFIVWHTPDFFAIEIIFWLLKFHVCLDSQKIWCLYIAGWIVECWYRLDYVNFLFLLSATLRLCLTIKGNKYFCLFLFYFKLFNLCSFYSTSWSVFIVKFG